MELSLEKEKTSLTRNPLAEQFALAETRYVVARMAQSFSSLITRDERPWTEHHTLILSPKNGVLCAVTPSS